MPAIINTGLAYIATKQGLSQPVVIDRFVLANIVGLDDTLPVDLNETPPAPADITWQGNVTQSGYVAENKVVYSLQLSSTIGDFSFNWIGLLASDDTLIAVSYLPTIAKTKTANGISGNNITRNFLLEFADAQSSTGIVVDANTWQIDFNARLSGIDERERLSNLDIYGRQTFINDGLKLEKIAADYQLKAGVGYVAGIRLSETVDTSITIVGTSTDVYLDVALVGDVSGVVAQYSIVESTTAQPDYTDGAGIKHYLEKIASLDASGFVTDARLVLGVTLSLSQKLEDLEGSFTSHIHPISAVTNLQTTLDSKANLAGATFTGEIFTTAVDGRNIATDGTKLDGIALNANNYAHPSHPGDDFSVDSGALSGATVISDIDINVTTDTQGHVTDANGIIATRTLTLSNLGYTGATNANNYTHPTSAGNKHIPSGGATGQFLKYSASGTAVWSADNNTVYSHPSYSSTNINTSGATIVDVITTNSTGHVTALGTRTLTAANIGALTTSGKAADSNLLDGINSSSFLRSDVNDNLTAAIIVPTGNRDEGMFGTYVSTKTQHIWSMGIAYRNSATGAGYGNLYGLAYKHAANGGSHAINVVQNGVEKCSFGTSIWTSGNVTAYSDERVKDNIEVIPDALDKVSQLNGYTFNRTDLENTTAEGENIIHDHNPDNKFVGVIAQELLEVLPEAVTGGPSNQEGSKDAHYSVAYGNLTALLIEAIKELKKEVDELKGAK